MDTEKKEEQKRKEAFYRDKFDEELVKLRRLIFGQGISIKKYITTDKGNYSETKTRKFIEELMGYIREYRFEEDNKLSVLSTKEAIDLFSIVDKEKTKELIKKYETQKKEYIETSKETYKQEDIFFTNLLYCTIRIALIENPGNPVLGDISDALKTLEDVYNDTFYLDYDHYGFINHDFSESLVSFHSGFYEDIISAILNFCTFQDNLFDKINAYYFILTNGHIPLKTDISKYEKTDTEHFKLLKERIPYLEDEEKAFKELQKQFPKKKNNLDLDWEEVLEDDEYPHHVIIDDDLYEEPPWPADALLKIQKSFKDSDLFIKSCELFRFYLNAQKTKDFRKHHSDDISLQQKYGYEDMYKKTDYAIERFISENDLNILSDSDKCVYIYTLLKQAEDIINEKIGGE